MKLSIGDTLWLVIGDEWKKNKHQAPAKVVKVGRKWADLDYGRYRVDMETMRLDGAGYTSPGKCYVSQSHYEQELAANKAWDYIAARISPSCRPEHVDLEDIKSIAALAGIELKGE